MFEAVAKLQPLHAQVELTELTIHTDHRREIHHVLWHLWNLTLEVALDE